MSELAPNPTEPSPAPAPRAKLVLPTHEQVELLYLDEIDPGTRLRQDYGDIPGMMASLKKNGQLQPIGINQDGRLVFGGRRYFAFRALQELGETDANGQPFDRIKVVRHQTLTEADLREMELEENIQRKDMTWQEITMATLEIHQLKSKLAAIRGETWNNWMTGLVVGVNRQRVDQILPIARYMQANSECALWTCNSFAEAARLLLDIRAEEGKKALAKQLTSGSIGSVVLTAPTTKTLGGETIGTGSGILSMPTPSTGQMMPGAVHTIGEPTPLQEVVINLAENIMLGSCLDHMAAMPAESRDHIITDPPYGIDMSMLQQDNTGMDVTQTVNEHQVDENVRLLRAFIPAAFRVLKPKGFLVMFCDPELWKSLNDLGEAAGFAVQRWPVVWCKPQAMNQAAGYNFTKATEFACVFRKKGAVLAQHQALNWRQIAKTADDKMFDHPFAKPFELWKWMCEAVSQPGDEIYDPFAGSHSGPCAFLKCGRKILSSERAEQHLWEGVTNVTKVYQDYFAKTSGVKIVTKYEPTK